jgi:hypothetical protein
MQYFYRRFNDHQSDSATVRVSQLRNHSTGNSQGTSTHDQRGQTQFGDITWPEDHHRELPKNFGQGQRCIWLEIEDEKSLFAPSSIAFNVGKEVQ